MRPMRSLRAAGRVDDLRALLERARVHPEVRELADVRVGHDLERQRERLESDGLRSTSSLPFSVTPVTGGRSTGLGR